jgi:STAS domain
MDGAAPPPTAVLLVDPDGTETVVGRVDARAPDLGLVDALLRLQVVARRRGRAVRVRDAPDALRELVELAGVAGCLRLEPRRQPERGEQLRVEEVVQPGDPPV